MIPIEFYEEEVAITAMEIDKITKEMLQIEILKEKDLTMAALTIFKNSCHKLCEKLVNCVNVDNDPFTNNNTINMNIEENELIIIALVCTNLRATLFYAVIASRLSEIMGKTIEPFDQRIMKIVKFETMSNIFKGAGLDEK